VGLLTFDGVGDAAYFRGGRALQRLWLTATEREWALQPMSAFPYLFARLRDGGEGFANVEKTDLHVLRERYRRLFSLKSEETEVLLFRLGRAGPASARSVRRPFEASYRWA